MLTISQILLGFLPLILLLLPEQPCPPLSQPDFQKAYQRPEQSPFRLSRKPLKHGLLNTWRRHAQSPFGQTLHTVFHLPLCPCKTHTIAHHAPCAYIAWYVLQYTCSISLNSMKRPFSHPLNQRTG